MAKLLSFGKIYIYFGLNFYFLAKILSFLGQTSITSWLNFYFLAKLLSLLGYSNTIKMQRGTSSCIVDG
jgi:hypothetical protein